MPFVEAVARQIKEDYDYTCQSRDCEDNPKSFRPTGTLMYASGFVVVNGQWNVQASHLRRRDYTDKYDYKRFNPDGTERGTIHCTLCHAVHEVGLGCYSNARTLLMGQTIRTFDYIKNNNYQDEDVPLEVGTRLGLGRLELIDLNNRRRESIRSILLNRFGTLVYQRFGQVVVRK